MTEEELQNVADFIVRYGTENTTTGAYCVTYKTIYDELFNSPPIEVLRQNHERIKEFLDTQYDELLSEIWDDIDYRTGEIVGFDCNFGLYYCPNYEGWPGESRS